MTAALANGNAAITDVGESSLTTAQKEMIDEPLDRAVGALESAIASTTAWLTGVQANPVPQITIDRSAMQTAISAMNDANVFSSGSALTRAEKASVHTQLAEGNTTLKAGITSSQAWIVANPIIPTPPTPPPPPPPPPPPDVGPSGVAMPSGDIVNEDGSQWIDVFHDDFSKWTCPLPNFPAGPDITVAPNSAPYFNKWTSYPHIDANDFHDTSGNGLYMSSACLSVNTVQNPRVLNIYMHTDPATKRPFVATPIPIMGGPGPEGGFQYLRTATRFRIDPNLASMLPGYKIAHLWWPDSEIWPGGGEIDGAECDTNGNIAFYWHFANGSPDGGQYYITTSVPAADGNWHTVIKEWTPEGIAVNLDDEDYDWNYGGDDAATVLSHLPPGPMNVRIQNETNLDGQYPDASVEGNIQIGWFVASSYQAA